VANSKDHYELESVRWAGRQGQKRTDGGSDRLKNCSPAALMLRSFPMEDLLPSNNTGLILNAPCCSLNVQEVPKILHCELHIKLLKSPSMGVHSPQNRCYPGQSWTYTFKFSCQDRTTALFYHILRCCMDVVGSKREHLHFFFPIFQHFLRLSRWTRT
jgi:hypothetical protein